MSKCSAPAAAGKAGQLLGRALVVVQQHQLGGACVDLGQQLGPEGKIQHIDGPAGQRRQLFNIADLPVRQAQALHLPAMKRQAASAAAKPSAQRSWYSTRGWGSLSEGPPAGAAAAAWAMWTSWRRIVRQPIPCPACPLRLTIHGNPARRQRPPTSVHPCGGTSTWWRCTSPPAGWCTVRGWTPARRASWCRPCATRSASMSTRAPPGQGHLRRARHGLHPAATRALAGAFAAHAAVRKQYLALVRGWAPRAQRSTTHSRPRRRPTRCDGQTPTRPSPAWPGWTCPRPATRAMPAPRQPGAGPADHRPAPPDPPPPETWPTPSSATPPTARAR